MLKKGSKLFSRLRTPTAATKAAAEHPQPRKQNEAGRPPLSPTTVVVDVDTSSPSMQHGPVNEGCCCCASASGASHSFASSASSASSAVSATASAASSAAFTAAEREEMLDQLRDLGDALLAKQAEITSISETLVATQSALYGATEDLKRRDERIAAMEAAMRRMQQEVESSRRTAAEKSALADLGSIGRSQAAHLSKLELLVEHLNSKIRRTNEQLNAERKKNAELSAQLAAQTAAVAATTPAETPAPVLAPAPAPAPTPASEQAEHAKVPARDEPEETVPKPSSTEEVSKTAAAAVQPQRRKSGKKHRHSPNRKKRPTVHRKRAARKRAFTTV